MQFEYKKFLVTLALISNAIYAQAEQTHLSTILNIKMNATYLDMDTETTDSFGVKLMAAVRLTLSTEHSCGTSKLHITPDSIGVPVEDFLAEVKKIKKYADDGAALFITHHDCDRKIPMATKFATCTGEICRSLTDVLIDGKMYLDKNYRPVPAARSLFFIEQPQTYDQKLKAWKVYIYDKKTKKIAADGFVDNEDYAASKFIHKFRTFHSNGMVSSSIEMSAQGQREGKSIVRHKNGKIEKSINYNNGIITDGEYITYDLTGKIKIREHYVNGVLNGPRVKLYANGNPESMEKYLDGSRSGISNYYYEDGTLKNIQDYDRGQLDGWDVKYFANGETESQTLYKNQRIRISHEWNIDGIKVSQWEQDENHNRQGDDIEWYDNGQKRKHSIYKDGKLHGKMQGWSEDGTQLYSTDYAHGERNGQSRQWGRDGTLIEDCQYQAGKISEPCSVRPPL
ncbi:toxin-antitoxin system YwqK family antitoxin [Pseudomonas synxantha]|uniref:toxin-antitoxin system YwqK family antitoxin n=1 Tax=Pseudomonas synxantha TaxID=47883 RepID=UPI00279408ED|nr:toxin-antitoxin system YwqK family antitoxin [Pseudomonas synxantha]MDQ0981785.1 antitoxin component YwqK of YwqJK toxin-antitoxin module [Pseudomonas synxantha]